MLAILDPSDPYGMVGHLDTEVGSRLLTHCLHLLTPSPALTHPLILTTGSHNVSWAFQLKLSGPSEPGLSYFFLSSSSHLGHSMSQPDHTHTYQCQWENVAIIGEEQAGAGLTLSNLEKHNLGAGRWLRGHLMGVWGGVSICIRGV